MTDSADSATDSADSAAEPAPRGVRWSVVAVAAVLALGAGMLLWNLWQSRQAQDGLPPTQTAQVVTREQMQELLAPVGHTVYWAGPQEGTQYELTLTGPDTYIRYLPPGRAAGDPAPSLTVATYNQDNPYQGLEASAAVQGARSEQLRAGALLVQPADSPTSAYFAFPGTHLLMEVYDPAPGRAYELVRSGAVQPFS